MSANRDGRGAGPHPRGAPAVAAPTRRGAGARASRRSSSAGRPPVLDGIDLTVAPGEFVCLVGASGCGKSTLLNLVAGLTEPTAGRIEVTAERPALMFQEPALLPWLTAAGNVELALRAARGRPGRAPGRGRAAARRGEPRRARAASGCTSSPAACASAWRWPARWPRTARCCSWTSRSPRSTRSPATSCTRSSPGSGPSRGCRSSSSRTTCARPSGSGQRVVLLGSRPGRVVREWQVDIPQPRTHRVAGRQHAGRRDHPRTAPGDQPPWPLTTATAAPARVDRERRRREPRRRGRARRARRRRRPAAPRRGSAGVLRPVGAAADRRSSRCSSAVWQLAYVAELKPPYALPSPADVAATFWETVQDGTRARGGLDQPAAAAPSASRCRW